MDEQKLIKLINDTVDQKMGSMNNLAIPNHVHNSWDANQLDPAIALLGFPVIQVADATVAPTDIPLDGTFRFQVDPTPRFRFWAYLNYTSGAGVLIGSWRVVTLT